MDLVSSSQDRVRAKVQDGQMVAAGRVVSTCRAKAIPIVGIDGEVRHCPADIHRPDVLTALLGDMLTTIDAARRRFRFNQPYALHFDVWLSIILIHRVKRHGSL